MVSCSMNPLQKHPAWLLVLLLCLAPVAATAQSRDANAQALKDIRETSDAICREVPLQGSSASVELSGQAKAELLTLVKKLGAAGISGAAKYSSSEYANVLQKDLSPLLQQAQQCRLRVFEKLSDLLLTPVKPPPFKPVKGAALGDLEFTLHSVQRAGGDVVAHFTIANSGQNSVELTLFGKGSRYGYGGSTLVAAGREYQAQSVNISGRESTEFIGRKYDPSAPITGSVRFNNIPSDVQAVDLLRIAFSTANLRPRGAFEYRAFSLE